MNQDVLNDHLESIKPKGVCESCGYRLMSVGKSRRNGKLHNDWATRKYHKKCWNELRERRAAHEYVEMIKRRI